MYFMFQTYVSSSDKELAAATIQSIGRCATTISEITDTCLNGLLNLLSNRNGLNLILVDFIVTAT